MQNEFRVQFPVNDKHSTSNNNDKTLYEGNKMECDIRGMDILQDKKEQTLLDRSLPSILPNVQVNQICNAEVEGYPSIKAHESEQNKCIIQNQDQIKNLIEDFSSQNKIYREDDLDKIDFSDDSDKENDDTTVPIDLDKNQYALQSEHIQLLYAPEEDGLESMNKYTGTKNEQSEVKEIPIPFEVKENENIAIIGIIESKVNEILLIKPSETTSTGVLDLDNIIFNSNKVAIGYIDDVIGNINQPLYVVKIFPNLDVKKICCENELVYYVKEKGKVLGMSKLKESIGKGSDASNMYDEEVTEDDKDFSDDEEEQNHKHRNKVSVLYFEITF